MLDRDIGAKQQLLAKILWNLSQNPRCLSGKNPKTSISKAGTTQKRKESIKPWITAVFATARGLFQDHFVILWADQGGSLFRKVGFVSFPEARTRHPVFSRIGRWSQGFSILSSWPAWHGESPANLRILCWHMQLVRASELLQFDLAGRSSS